MRVYPQNIEQKLEVDQIRQLIDQECVTEGAKRLLEKASPIKDFEKLTKLQEQTREALHILTMSEGKPRLLFEDIDPFLKKLITSGTYLYGEDFITFKNGLKAIHDWTSFLKKKKEEYQMLFRLTLGFISDIELVEEIDRTIDEKGEIRSDASTELVFIRSSLTKAERKVRKSIKSVLDQSKRDKYSEDDSEITIRDGRLVIPVKAEFKRQISGFVHDESSTGQTVFMEPSQVLALNNEVREWYHQEKREVQRILTVLSDAIRSRIDDLQKGSIFLSLIDFIVAKANFAIKMGATVPQVTKTPSIKLFQAYHPLLKRVNDLNGKPTVPLNIELTHDGDRIMIISGPNAGGKSVAMKTVGLTQYLFQCGFPVCADESSVLGVFQNIFIDIGDAQSLENDLSTYSSRLKAMKYFTDVSGKRSLVLIDEFGSGTEPQFGGALAEAILDRLHQQKCYGVITTHYANIKQYAESAKGMINAAMSYDTQKLQPLYELMPGRPGSSFAFEIAQKTGLDQKLLSFAKEKVGNTHVDYERLLTDLETDKNKTKKQLAEVHRKEEELKQLKKDYESLKGMIDRERKTILKTAKQDAKNILEGANRTVEKTIREIKEAQADKEKTKLARRELEKEKDQLSSFKKDKKSNEKQSTIALKVGDKVSLAGQDSVGEVISVGPKQVQVGFGPLKSFVDKSRLIKVSNKQAKKTAKRGVKGINLNDKMISFKQELDIRGKRAEECSFIVDEWLDQAILLGIQELKLVHGKGHGVLRELVRNQLKSHPYVKSVANEHEDRGGSGITLISLSYS